MTHSVIGRFHTRKPGHPSRLSDISMCSYQQGGRLELHRLCVWLYFPPLLLCLVLVLFKAEVSHVSRGKVLRAGITLYLGEDRQREACLALSGFVSRSHLFKSAYDRGLHDGFELPMLKQTCWATCSCPRSLNAWSGVVFWSLRESRTR
jgi:hypothetical protein